MKTPKTSASSDKLKAVRLPFEEGQNDDAMLMKLTLLLSALGALRDVIETLLGELEESQRAEMEAKQRALLEARVRTGAVLFVSLLNVVLLVLVLLK